MTIALYSYKADPLNGAELRHSLRSIERHLHPSDYSLEVVVVGDLPDWLNDRAYYIPGNRYPAYGPRNVAYNVREACKQLIDEKVIYLDDDYILWDHTAEPVPVYWGYLDDHQERVRRVHGLDHWYTQAFDATRRLLMGHRQVFSWELHRPLVIEPRKAIEHLEWLDKADVPALWRTVYATRAQVFGYKGTDARYVGNTASPERNHPWTSLDQSVPNRVSQTFDRKSRWEK